MGHRDVVSVIVPVYNVEKYLRRCLDSLVSQTYEPLEIILVDDGSIDSCGGICDEYAQKYDCIKVIHKSNGGLSHARNTGLDAATGDFVTFVDSDDFVDPEMCAVLKDAIDKNGADVSCVGIVKEYENGKPSCPAYSPGGPAVFCGKEGLREVFLYRAMFVSAWAKLYRRELFCNVRFPVGETDEDSAVVTDLLYGRTVAHAGRHMYHYLTRSGSITASYSRDLCLYSFKNMQNTKDFVSKNCPELMPEYEYYMATKWLIYLSSYEGQKEVTDENAAEYYGEYKKYWKRLITMPGLSKKRKLKAVFLRFGILKLYYAFKFRKR